jgi:flagellar protein FlgJ
MSDLRIPSAQDLSALTAAQPKKLDGLKGDKLLKAAKEFEGVYMDIVVKSMRTTEFGVGDFMGDSPHVKMYQQLLDSEYAKQIGHGKGLGIAETLVKQLSAPQIDPSRVPVGEPKK